MKTKQILAIILGAIITVVGIYCCGISELLSLGVGLAIVGTTIILLSLLDRVPMEPDTDEGLPGADSARDSELD